MIREILEWFAPAEKLPDDGETVLVKAEDASEPVWPGYLTDGDWHTADGVRFEDGDVLAWAHIPSGPP